MLIEAFNRAWESERQRIALRLSEVLENELKSIRTSLMVEESAELKSELNRMLPQLVLRRSLVDIEAEEIVKRRMDMRASYLAIVVSASALLISALTACRVFLRG